MSRACAAATVSADLPQDSPHARFLHAYPTANPSLKYAVYERDHFTCQDCGFIGTPGLGFGHIQAHHIQAAVALGGGHEPGNLITLCGRCHARRHVPLRRAYWARQRDEMGWGPTQAEIAAALGVSITTARDWQRRGLIPAFQTRAELEEYARSPQRRRPRPGCGVR